MMVGIGTPRSHKSIGIAFSRYSIAREQLPNFATVPHRRLPQRWRTACNRSTRKVHTGRDEGTNG